MINLAIFRRLNTLIDFETGMQMNMRTRIKKLGLLLLAAYFAGSYVYLGNPVIESFADHGSDGLNTVLPCTSKTFNSNVIC